MKNILENVTITPNVTKGRSVQETKEILSYMLVASLTIQQQILSQKISTPKTTSSQTTRVNFYNFYFIIIFQAIIIPFFYLKTGNTTNQITPNSNAINITQKAIANIFDGGLFEKDIVLTVKQAFGIFAKYFDGSQSTRQKRQILNVDEYNPNSYNIPEVSNSTLWSQEPTIIYMFEASLCKLK